MKEKTIKIEDYSGDGKISRDDGLILRKKIVENWHKHDHIVLDFGNDLIASVSFIDEAFAKLAFEYSKEELMARLKFENMRPFDRAMLNDLIMKRLNESEKKTGKKVKKAIA